jgi:hypothetical protein
MQQSRNTRYVIDRIMGHEMSSQLSIASVTSVIKGFPENGLVVHGASAVVGDLSVTALPPDRIATGADERSQLNISHTLRRADPWLERWGGT